MSKITLTWYEEVSMIDICQDCDDEIFCVVCRVEEERKWAAYFANDRTSYEDLTGAYEPGDVKGWSL